MEPQKHPPGLYVLFFTEMWERFGFYSMLAMFVLYLTDPEQGFKWSAEDATHLYANYLMFVYASPLIGGWIADKKLGYRNSVLLGGLIFMIGYFILTIRAEWAVYLALTCLVIGNGFFKPNVSAMVGHLYPEGSPLKDRAYNIFYMGINIGALLAPINGEILVNGFSFQESLLGFDFIFEIKGIGFNNAFAVAGLGMILSVAILWKFKHHLEGGGARHSPTADPAAAATSEDVAPIATPARPIDAVPDAVRIGALIVIFLIVIVFWMVFHQNGSTLTYWANDNTDWKLTGIISNAINPFWVVTLTFPLVWFWKWLDQRGLEPSTPTKMAMGMLLSAVSFAILYSSATRGEAIEVTPDMVAQGDFRLTDRALTRLSDEGVPDSVLDKLRTKDEEAKFVIKGRKFKSDVKVTGEEKMLRALRDLIGEEQTQRYRAAILKHAYLFKVAPFWLILAYAVMTLGELMLSPMGLSLVSKVAPVRMRGLMMGGWFVATAVGNKLTAIGVYWEIWRQSSFFAVLGGLALVSAVILFLLLKPLKKAMPGV